jgi:hypothetical protein
VIKEDTMKFRKDFVTNSSSSSYICEICGDEEFSYERPDWLTCCVNGHTICCDHLVDDSVMTNEDGEVEETNCPICLLQMYSQYEMASYLLITRKISRDEVFAEIKKVNKRRKKLYDSEYIQYVFNKFNLTEDSIMNEIRSKFSTWHEFINYEGESK